MAILILRTSFTSWPFSSWPLYFCSHTMHDVFWLKLSDKSILWFVTYVHVFHLYMGCCCIVTHIHVICYRYVCNKWHIVTGMQLMSDVYLCGIIYIAKDLLSKAW